MLYFVGLQSNLYNSFFVECRSDLIRFGTYVVSETSYAFHWHLLGEESSKFF